MMVNRFIPASTTAGSSVNKDKKDGPTARIANPMGRADSKGIGHGDEIASAHPVFLPGAVVLSNEAAAGRIEGGHHVVNQRILIGRSGVARPPWWHQRS